MSKEPPVIEDWQRADRNAMFDFLNELGRQGENLGKHYQRSNQGDENKGAE